MALCRMTITYTQPVQAICHLPHGPIIFIKIVRYVPGLESSHQRLTHGPGEHEGLSSAKIARHNLIMNRILVRML